MAGDAETAAALRRWASGVRPIEAASELLIRAMGGRFARPENLWVRAEQDRVAWIDWRALNEENLGALSGGERRMLLAAASLGGGGQVDLGDVATGIDHRNVRLLLAAIAHAAGAAELSPWP